LHKNINSQNAMFSLENPVEDPFKEEREEKN
jgi:hypothetical protein